MKTRKKLPVAVLICAASVLVLSLTALLCMPLYPYGFARDIPETEQQLRLALVQTAESWLGTAEGSAEHAQIIDGYNSHQPLAQGYEVKYSDDWCATFVSFAAISCELTDIIPTECGCERQIGLFQDLGRWEEKDSYLPLPGDIIYYDWDVRTLGDSTGWSDHVGIVAGTWGPFIKVIEGNKDDAVGYRYILRWDPRIRGYGLPDFEK